MSEIAVPMSEDEVVFWARLVHLKRETHSAEDRELIALDAAIEHFETSPVGMTNPDATWAMGDFNGDGIVDGSDATLLASHWQEGANLGSTVPEPSTWILLLGLLLMAAARRKR